ncbi:MAG: hypothetical protein PVF68_12515 [Acidobacteriota bacterium]|jgi:hypothetical protein
MRIRPAIVATTEMPVEVRVTGTPGGGFAASFVVDLPPRRN